MKTRLPSPLTLWLLLLLLILASPVVAQYGERPDLIGSESPAVDASGRSIKSQRVRAIHTTDPGLEGGTAYFLSRDPFLAYQLGRNLNYREFRSRDGVFNADVSGLGGPMPDTFTAKITARNHTSCSGCHNLPQGNPGGGTNFHKDSGFGRNAPHYYGAGIVEMLAIQIRTEILLQVDEDGNGWISVAEASTADPYLWVRPVGGAPAIDFGNPRLSDGSTGSPRLNNIFRVWYVDADGRHIPEATEVDGVTTFGYNLDMIVWGWGQGPGRAALNPTNRAFYWDPASAHSGLDAYDPSTMNDPDGDGVSEPTLAGAIQFPATHKAPDAGDDLDPLGFSRDDPDGDGYLNEISEGDLDLAEWFMLNAPRPAFVGSRQEYNHGIRAMTNMGCTDCHLPSWHIRGQDGDFAGDRRLFDLDVKWNPSTDRVEGILVRLHGLEGEDHVPNRDSFVVEGIFTDFRHHDMGDELAEKDFGGTINTVWRTAPLWGVGSGFPWGHDGQSFSLEDVILRHGGEAAASREAWRQAGSGNRRKVLNLLEKLVLYDIESLPADIDGDGVISTNFMVAGMDTGMERFNAEWLFRNPVRIQGLVENMEGVMIRSDSGTNIDEAYGQLLFWRRDTDHDGWPDVWDEDPDSPGYKDGVNN